MELFDTFLFSLISKHEEPLNLLILFNVLSLYSYILLYRLSLTSWCIIRAAQGGMFLLKFANLPDATLQIITQDIKQQLAVMPKSHEGQPGQPQEGSEGECAIATVPLCECRSGS